MPCMKNMRGCHANCRHRNMVTEYSAARHYAEMVREGVTKGYDTELRNYGPIITFKDWLIGQRRD
jgi:hypothetical protein